MTKTELEKQYPHKKGKITFKDVAGLRIYKICSECYSDHSEKDLVLDIEE